MEVISADLIWFISFRPCISQGNISQTALLDVNRFGGGDFQQDLWIWEKLLAVSYLEIDYTQ